MNLEEIENSLERQIAATINELHKHTTELSLLTERLKMLQKIIAAEKREICVDVMADCASKEADCVHKKPRYIVFFKTCSGKTVTVNVLSPHSTIGCVKEILQAIDGSPCNQIRLVYGARQLEDDRRLIDYHIQNESTIHVVARLCGC